MELFVIWIGTIITSFTMEFKNELRMFKDVADNGYKIDIKRISEFAKQANPNVSKASLMSMLIPGLNIWDVLRRILIYNNARCTILSQLSVSDLLIEMTKEEEEEYNKKPTGLNAFLIMAKPQVESKIESVTYIDDGEKSTIWYQIKHGEYIIVNTRGPVSYLSIIEQYGMLKEKVLHLNEDTNETSFSLEFNKENNLENDINKNDLSTQEKIKQLENLKLSTLENNITDKETLETHNNQKRKIKQKK